MVLFQLIKHKLRLLLRKFGVNKAVLFGVLTKIWAIIAGPITALLIITKFTPEYQGYYYTFLSLLAFQVFVELGLGTVIIQFASHEWAKLSLDDSGSITGDKSALSRLASLAGITLKWYLAGGVIIAFGLGFIGYIFFLHSQTINVNWPLPWFSLCFLTGISICFIPLWSLLEGCNQVSVVYSYRFFQGIIASLAIWIAILLGARLWSVSISAAASILFAIIFFKCRYRNFIKSLLFSRSSHFRINWRNEIFPMQWRIALSWVSAYFAFSFFTPVIFYYYGPVIAGQFGITWSIVGVVSTISSSWLYPNVPMFGMLIAEKKYAELDFLFGRITKLFIFITVLSAIAVWFVIYVLTKLHHPFSTRMLPVFPTALFLTAQVIIMLSVPFSAYLRAHKREPFLWISITEGGLTAFSTFIFGKYCSVTAIGLGYLIVNIMTLPFIFLIWQRCRVRWHTENPVRI